MPRNQATRNDIIRMQEKARRRRFEAAICIPLAIIIAWTYGYALAGLFGKL